MKLILTQEVTGLGAPGDVVEVKDGYGRNYLVPRGLAMRWTRGGEKTVESIKSARASRAVRDRTAADDGVPFSERMGALTAELRGQFAESARLERAIRDNLRSLGYEV